MRVAHNRVIDASRREQTRRDAEPLLLQLAGEAEATATEHESFPDERLKLLLLFGGVAHFATSPSATVGCVSPNRYSPSLHVKLMQPWLSTSPK